MQDILGVYNNLKDMYIQYMDSPFALGNRWLADERREILQKEGIIHQLPYVEALPSFKSSGNTIREACEIIGLSGDFAEFASHGLFGADLALHLHQFEAFQRVIQKKRNVVVTSGTGSGKTESFLIPLIASIVNESASWEKPRNKQVPWWELGNKWMSQRSHDVRSAAVRGLILYPLNALVEDQLTRLRRALDSDKARKWLDRYRAGNRIHFGRYTGKTPVSGRQIPAKVRKLQKTLQNMSSSERELRTQFENLVNMVRESVGKEKIDKKLVYQLQRELPGYIEEFGQTLSEEDSNVICGQLQSQLEERLCFISQPGEAEMVSRWDMQDTPPDILITNFSMLNIMLTRKIEQSIFEKTRDWLQEDKSNTFFLIVDELHTYRGTAGTEVSYVIRALLNRLSLTPDSPQLRIIATSASLNESGADFLQDFFGAATDSFDILSGEREIADKYIRNNDYKGQGHTYASFYTSAQEQDVDASIRDLCQELGSPYNEARDVRQQLFEALNKTGILQAFVKTCTRPNSIRNLGNSLFGTSEDLTGIAGFLLALTFAQNNGQVVIPLRGHLFFRNFQGLWACSNANCSAVDKRFIFEGRPIGKLYAQPQVSCSCGGRVLDFYYCQNCGDVFLGGYKTPHKSAMDESYALSADFPELEQLPDKLPPSKRYGDYAVYWPSLNISSESAQPWTRNGNKFHFAWQKSRLNPFLGSIQLDPTDNPTGYWFRIWGEPGHVNIPAFPIKCPSCDDDWEGSSNHPVESSSRTRSPIRWQRTSFDKVSQVLIDSLMRELPDNETPKIVLFSDSRQDAAKLSIKLEQGHYLDLVRRVISSVATDSKLPIQAWIKRCKGRELTENEESRANEYKAANFRLARDIEDYHHGNLPEEMMDEIGGIIARASLPPSLKDMWHQIEMRIVNLGLNPAGPYKSLQKNRTGGIPWTSLYNFSNPSNVTVPAERSNEEDNFHNVLKRNIQWEVANTLFSQRKRDFESLALGTMVTDPELVFEDTLGKPSYFWRQLFDSSVRMLGANRRYSGSRKSPVDFAPSVLRNYWNSVANRNNLSAPELTGIMEAIFRRCTGISQYIIQADLLHVVAYTPNSPVYICSKCHRVHLHRSCDTCTDCHADLVCKELEKSEVNNYYRFLAEDPRTEMRIHAEELTGQTDADDASKRQKAFQGIFDHSDLPLVDEIDILSVTTTMEAGVDIGSLRIVAMSNMPPQRFNYQQRVGRCGRRGTPLSVSLTMCRGRSHDDWHFDNLDRITGDPPPQPYIDVNSVKIFKRVLIKEILFQSLKETGLLQSIGESRSVHGDFGTCEAWSNYEETLRNYLASKQGGHATNRLITSLSNRTALSNKELLGLFHYVSSGDLLDDIQSIINDDRYSHITPLSECLATAGLLPMFGFPTRVRLLHHERRSESTYHERLGHGVVDRDLEIAISEYAPGSQIVKEKAKHRVVGIAHYFPQGGRVMAEPEPLGRIRTIALCKHCQMLFDDSNDLPDNCPSCGLPKDTVDGVFRHLPVSEPMGFRSDWIERDFVEEFDWVSRGSAPRLAQRSPDVEDQIFNTSFSTIEGDIYTLNDNNGNLFTFYKAKNAYDGWIEQNCIDKDEFNPALTNISVTTALGSIKNTEVLVLRPAEVKPGVTMNPRILGVRAALYSLGFLFRRVAADVLDIDADELQVGIRTKVMGQKTSGEIFLADRLINGAGYSKFLGRPEVLTKLMKDLVGNLSGAPNLRNHDCDSSCYECLRTYENMSFHGLLDWRLAFDMAQLLVDNDYVPGIDSRWGPLVKRALHGLISSYPEAKEQWFDGVPAIVFPDDALTLLFGHPLWEPNKDFMNDEFSAATVKAEEEFQGFQIHHYNIFDLVRRPVWIINDMLMRLQ